MKKLLVSVAASLMMLEANAVATNYALSLQADVKVDCGVMTRLGNASSYTVQLWIKPELWTPGAVLLSLGNRSSVALADEGSVMFTVNGESLTASSQELTVGRWSQLTLLCDNGNATIMVNATEAMSGVLPAMPSFDEPLVIGGGYCGLIDEVRLWNDVLTPDFNYFIGNTVNRWNPQIDNLAAYYKFDQIDCDEIVDYVALWKKDAPQQYNNHGVVSGKAVRVDASDNTGMPYLLNGAYTANERFYDRAVEADQYLLSNDLIILGIQSYSDGHLKFVTPNNHGELHGGATRQSSFDGRDGVLSLDGTGNMTCPSTTLQPKISASGETLTGYTVEAWVYVEEWVEGAYIFRKESADGQSGFSLRLGSEESHQLIARCNGNDYVQQKRATNDPQLLSGSWSHIAVTPGLASAARNTFVFVVDGKSGGATASLSSSQIDFTPENVDDAEAVVGEKFIGKIDELAVWNRTFGVDEINQHAVRMPMPGIGKAVTAGMMMDGNAFYTFDKSENPGYSSISQDEWKAIMTSAYEGHTGYEVRISVKSHDGWLTTIADPSRRRIFAEDLARLSENYDGVELDLEWDYGTQTTLGLLSDEIRKALPADKSFMISCHNVAYRFPRYKMDNCDGFTFQQYGPQNMHSYFSHFKSMINTFVDYGFERKKIIGSYATTTSKGYKDGTAQIPIMGVKDGFLDGDGYEPDPEIDYGDVNGCRFYFCSPLQTYNRARYIMENNLGGIFYWDMGNDLPVNHKYNMAKWCSYGLNSNVEPRVTEVAVNHPAGVENVSHSSFLSDILLRRSGDVLCAVGDIAVGSIEIYNMAGACVLAAEGNSVDISSLFSGVYVVKVTLSNGKSISKKYIH